MSLRYYDFQHTFFVWLSKGGTYNTLLESYKIFVLPSEFSTMLVLLRLALERLSQRSITFFRSVLWCDLHMSWWKGLTGNLSVTVTLREILVHPCQDSCSSSTISALTIVFQTSGILKLFLSWSIQFIKPFWGFHSKKTPVNSSSHSPNTETFNSRESSALLLPKTCVAHFKQVLTILALRQHSFGRRLIWENMSVLRCN